MISPFILSKDIIQRIAKLNLNFYIFILLKFRFAVKYVHIFHN